MGKKQALLNLKAHIEAGKELIRHHYISYKNDKPCYCAVGFIMKECELGMILFEEDSELNEITIGSERLEEVTSRLIGEGFEISELRYIQRLNDNGNTEEMVKFIDSILGIKKEEVSNG